MAKWIKWPVCAALASAALLLSGCQNSRNDSDNDDYAFDSVGEQHVFEQPKKRVVAPVRSETPRVLRQQPAVASRSYEHVGEENVFDN